MGTYAVHNIRYPFDCKWKCVHCGEENIDTGHIEIKGQSDAYSSVSKKQAERAANIAFNRSIVTLEAECGQVIKKVNHLHKYHNALASIKEPCSCCGKKQPWQMSMWLKIFRYASLAVAIVGTLMMYVSVTVDIDPKLMTVFELVAGVCSCLFLFSFLLSFILRRIGFKKAVSMGETYYPEVEFDCVPTVEDLQYFNEHPDIWICPRCKTENKKSRGTCSKCGYTK